MIVAVLPACNEAESLSGSVASVRDQVDRVLIVPNNYTDDTVAVARSLGVDVLDLGVGHPGFKAGALNAALRYLAPDLSPDDAVLVMDADTRLVSTWVAEARERLADRRVGGVGAVFQSDTPTSYLTLCQRLEWVRYAEETHRTGKTFVMSGTAALIRWDALESVRARFGYWYDEHTITEDSRLSIDLKLCGWELRSPIACKTITETMPTWRLLWKQRRRWYLGAMQNAVDVGVNRISLPYWRQQIMLGISVLLMATYLTVTGVAIGMNGLIVPAPLWIAVGAIFATERVVTIWSDSSWRERLFSVAVLPELVYALVLQSAYVGALVQKIRRSHGTWAHVTPKEV